MDPEQCYCDPTTQNKQVCNLSSFIERKSPFTSRQISNELVKPPETFLKQLIMLSDAKKEGIEALKRVILELETGKKKAV